MDECEARAQQAEAMVAGLRARLSTLRDIVEKEEITKLTAENAKLEAEIAAGKAELRAIKAKQGLPHVPLPGEPGYKAPPPAAAAAAAQPLAPAKAAAPAKAEKKTQGGEPKKAKAGKAAKGGGAVVAPAEIDVSLLDLRVGLVTDAKMHPESDKLFIENIDTGSESIVVLSGLNGKVPLEAMQNRLVVLLMNLKPAKMGGIMSNAMVMCASADTVEPVDPPAGAVPGDVITFPGISGEGKAPATANAMKKKKYLEQILPDLKTDIKCVATYKGVPFTVEGKGVCTVKTMTDAFIK